MQTDEGEILEEGSSKMEHEDFVMEGHGKTPPPGEENKQEKEQEKEEQLMEDKKRKKEDKKKKESTQKEQLEKLQVTSGVRELAVCKEVAQGTPRGFTILWEASLMSLHEKLELTGAHPAPWIRTVNHLVSSPAGSRV